MGRGNVSDHSLVWVALALSIAAPVGMAEPSTTAALDSHSADAQRRVVKPALMLANLYREGIDLSEYWVSEKLDGVRAYWDGAHLISRGGNRIQSPAWFTVDFPPIPLDGELWMGRGAFERLSGTIRRQEPDPEAWRGVRYLVFDLPGMPGPFGQRLQVLRRLLANPTNPRIALVEQFRVADHAALMKRMAAVVRDGGEGLMLHRDGSGYRAGRSDDLLKVKPYLDAEARVIAHLPGKGKYEGMLGALLVEDDRGRRFRLAPASVTPSGARRPPSVVWSPSRITNEPPGGFHASLVFCGCVSSREGLAQTPIRAKFLKTSASI